MNQRGFYKIIDLSICVLPNSHAIKAWYFIYFLVYTSFQDDDVDIDGLTGPLDHT